MLVISAFTPGDYEEMVAETRQRCHRWGYGYQSYPLPVTSDLDGLMPPCTFKPGVITRGLRFAHSGELCAWLDADAIPVQPFAAELKDRCFDLAVTLREPAAIGQSNPTTNYLNAGVIFFRKTSLTTAFLGAWGSETKSCGNDQLALNRLVGPDLSDDAWRAAYEEIFTTSAGAKALILPATEWNCWHLGSVGPDVKILHFKRGFRQLYGQGWWRRKLSEIERKQ